ncbi:MAG: VPLPA-CTERM sorting domain-containing protein [Paracoccaceae bacterium]
MKFGFGTGTFARINLSLSGGRAIIALLTSVGTTLVRRMLLAFVLSGFATSSYASVLDISVNFSGGQLGAVSFDVRVDAILTAGNIDPTTDGLTINSLSFTPAGGLGYSYSSALDRLNFFGLSQGVSVAHNESDFFVGISPIATLPSITLVFDSSFLQPVTAGFPTSTTLSVTPVPAVPLPATGLLLLAGLGCVAAFKRQKSAHKIVD